MAFICNDCGNTSTKKFAQGKCPACDSFNIKTTHKTTQQAIKEKEPKTLIELVILALLWGLLAYGAWDRYLKPEPTVQAKIKTAPTVEKKEEPALDF